MREFSVAEIKRHFAVAGEPTATGYDLGELRWRMYQWRKLGLVYFSERLDRLDKEGRLTACFAVGPYQRGPVADQFVPEPFPILADVYQRLRANHQWDRSALLSVLAQYKVAYETRHAGRRLGGPQEHELYYTFIDRFYDTDRPYKGKRLYWILFDERGVEYFSESYDLQAEQLEKFMAPREN